MKRFNFLLVLKIACLFSIFDNCNAKENYKIEDIPEGLLKNATAVIRMESTVLEIYSENDARIKKHVVISILNEGGKEYGIFYDFYDKYKDIRKLRGKVYDAQGNILMRLLPDDFEDYSAISGFSLYDDNRVRYVNPEVGTYPYTVEFSYEIKLNGLLYFPEWRLYPGYHVSVENTTFTIKVPREIDIRFKGNHLESLNGVVKDNETGIYKWVYNNLNALTEEPYSGSFALHVPSLYITPVRFKMDRYDGSFESWKSFGKWIYQLNEERGKLPEKTINEINNLVKNEKGKRDKVKKIYTYLQNKTRYVSIQVGIGGWQPFEAMTVDEYSYGDCKALTNYTKALLKAVGIPSYYCLINAGKEALDVDPDFPISKFNHSILCVPLANDTIWLECTSQQNPFGYTGTFTSDRYALLVSQEGGKLLKTNSYKAHDNTEYRKGVVNIDKNGNGTAEISTAYRGIQYENDHLDRMVYEGRIEQKRWLYSKLDIPGFDIKDFEFKITKQRIPEIVENISIKLDNYATISGKRMFLKPNLANYIKEIPGHLEKRKTKIIVRFPELDNDTIIYDIPEEYQIEYLTKNMAFNTKFGFYTSKTVFKDDKIFYIRQLRINKGSYPPSDYDEFRNFFLNVAKADKAQIVLIKKDDTV